MRPSIALAFVSVLTAACTPITSVDDPSGAVDGALTEPPRPENGGHLLEEVDPAYRKRFDAWRKIFRSLKSGAALWDKYDTRTDFVLRATVQGRSDEGGGELMDRKWKNGAIFVGATMRLAPSLGQSGTQDPDVYPLGVTLQDDPDSAFTIPSEVRIAQVIAHEIGHAENGLADGAAYITEELALQTWDYAYKAHRAEGLSDEAARAADDVKEQERILGGTPEEIHIIREHRADLASAAVVIDYYRGHPPRAVQDAIDKLRSDPRLKDKNPQ